MRILVACGMLACALAAAGVVEIHNTRMEGSVMRMAAVDSVELPANRTVKLAPAGYHVMLMDLERTLKAGERVPLRLTFERAGKIRETVELDVEVRPVTGEAKHAH